MIIRINAKEAFELLRAQLGSRGAEIEIVCNIQGYLLPATVDLTQDMQRIILPNGYSINTGKKQRGITKRQ